MNSCPPSRSVPSAPAHEIPSKKHRSTAEKSLAYESPRPFLLRCRNRVENGASVTTRHLFSPNQPRRATFPLRNWQPNPLTGCASEVTHLPPGGGGVRCADVGEGFDPKRFSEFLP